MHMIVHVHIHHLGAIVSMPVVVYCVLLSLKFFHIPSIHARSFTMAGLASDDALRGDRYCGYSVIQKTA